jgi:hypothetical protein
MFPSRPDLLDETAQLEHRIRGMETLAHPFYEPWTLPGQSWPAGQGWSVFATTTGWTNTNVFYRITGDHIWVTGQPVARMLNPPNPMLVLPPGIEIAAGSREWLLRNTSAVPGPATLFGDWDHETREFTVPTGVGIGNGTNYIFWIHGLPLDSA